MEVSGGLERARRPGLRARADRRRFDGKDFRTEKAQRAATSSTATRSRLRPGSGRRRRSGAILSIGEDYFEGKGHGLYLLDGKLRLHITFRFSDLGMRVETADAAAGRKAAARTGHLRRRHARGGRPYVRGRPRAAPEGAVRLRDLAD